MSGDDYPALSAEQIERRDFEGLTMTPADWIGALANAWWLGHRDVCNDCNCREDSNPYHLRT